MRSSILVKSRKKNRYFIDRKLKRTLLCHPLLYYILRLAAEGKDLKDWLEQLPGDPVQINDIGIFSRSEIEYYYKKYLILKENGHFENIDQEKRLSGRLTSGDVKDALANVRLVTFEITDKCQLKCAYCGYGKFYDNYDKRENKSMNLNVGIRILNYLLELWNSPLNHSHNQDICIGFYGGEPLLNFGFIEKMIAHVKELKLLHNRLRFSMTTNGLLVEKYMDFLVENDFNLLVSLDGNEMSNEYRVFPNETPAFPFILRNIEALQKKYPDYFKNRVNFNAVLHNKNSVSEIYHFFKQHFGKTPGISALNTSGINKAQKKAFWKTYANISESLYKSEDYSLIEKEMFIKLPNIQGVSTFLHMNNDFSFNDYNELLYPCDNQVTCPTGTCFPFSKKIFVTVNGKILPCERIGHRFALGWVDQQAVTIDCEEIANNYNTWYDKLRKQCYACHYADHCSQCIFNIDITAKNPVCNGYMNYKEYSGYLASNIDFIESKPSIYSKILKEVILS
ncbi:MAG: radical SAM peptide maturase [Candidatus Aminicenantes bacterium]|nr:radical SAM peptide maturase [Candidatus Aminicenantes bacterium]